MAGTVAKVAAAAIAAAALAVPASTGASGAPQCATSQLKISLGGFQGGVGHGGYPIVFRNHGSLCTMYGYPGVDGLTAGGKDVVHAKRTLFGYLGGTHRIATVTVAPGKTASAFFEGLNATAQGQPCHEYSQIEVTPPNDTQSVRLKAGPVCEPQIHPVVPGSSGSERP